MSLSLTQKGLLLVSVPLACEIGFVAYLWSLVEHADRVIAEQEHARLIQGRMNALTRDLVEAGTTAGSYSCPNFLGNYSASLAKTDGEFKQLEQLTAGRPDELRIVKQVELLAQEGKSLVNQGHKLLAAGQVDAANDLLVGSLKPLVGRLNQEASLLTEAAKTTEMKGPEQRARMQEQVRVTLMGGIALNILVALSLAVFFMRNTVRKVERVMDNTTRLAKRQALHPPIEGNDEIAHLDRVLREMASALDAHTRKERAIFDNARDMICTIGEGGVFSQVSPACEEVLGYSQEELIGKWLVEIVEESEVNRTIELLKRKFKGECEAPFEMRLRRKDGKLVHTLWSAQWSAQENCLFCVAHEITERKVAEELLKASEARVRLILEATPVGIMSVNADGVVQTGNPAAEAMFGVEDITGCSLRDIFRLSNGKGPIDFLRDNLDRTVRFEAVKADGGSFPAEITIKQFEGTSGLQYLLVTLDISEREQIEKMKQDFFAMVSHELRTPLTSVQGFLEVLGAGGYGVVPEKALTKCEVASRNVKRLIELINDILDAEKLESGCFEFRFSDVRLLDVLDRSVDAVREFAERSEVTLDVDGLVDGVTVADEERLVQVVINLLSNAVKFSPPCSTVTLSVRDVSNSLEVSVADQGDGIPDEYRQVIFERFGQVRGAKSRHKGSGLGLAICKKIIEQHHGQIGVESTAGEGSRFWFRVPKVKTTASV
jgi:PAS domain S-box-containing protein